MKIEWKLEHLYRHNAGERGLVLIGNLELGKRYDIKANE